MHNARGRVYFKVWKLCPNFADGGGARESHGIRLNALVEQALTLGMANLHLFGQVVHFDVWRLFTHSGAAY
jgi:hypothetical protein